MKHITVLTLLSTMLLTLPHSTTGTPNVTPVECPMKIPAGYRVECGIVTAPEDHTQPNSPRIQLAIATVHSTSDAPAPDPLLFIGGGPGGGTLDSMPLWLPGLHPLLARRDLIFFDQRGTGYSRPALTCTEIDPLATTPQEALRMEDVLACRDRLAGSGINLSTYNSRQNAADIALLRQALGYEEWNLYGVSYGARVALTVLRDHPPGVRSVVLDAITPVEANLLLEDPAQAETALQRLVAACQADLVCRTAYPNLAQTYAALVRDLAEAPVVLEITNPQTGQSRTEALNGATFNGLVVGALGTLQASGIPGLVHETRIGNYEPIVAYLQSTWASEESTPGPGVPAVGLQLAVLCSEEAPFITPEAMAEMRAAYPPDLHLFAALDTFYYEICRAWGIGPADPLENTPVVSDVPALVLAGEYDAARSPNDARRAAEMLPHSTVIEFPGAGHAVALAGTCPSAVMARFLDDPASTPDAGCTAHMDTPHFFITVALTRPLAHVVAAMAAIAGPAIVLCAGVGLGRLALRRQIPWRVTLRRVGWQPLAISALATAALYWAWPVIGLSFFYEYSLAQVIVMVGPIVAAVQAAFLFAPEDEPALETVLACPRPFRWLPIERTAVALLGQGLVAAVALAVGAWGLGERLPLAGPLAFLWWLSSALLLSGLAAFVSVRSRQTMLGVLLALLTWLVLGTASSNQFDDVLLPPVPLGFYPGWPRLFDLFQPFFWLIHPFLRPGSLTTADFILNRTIVGGLGLVLMALAAGKLADAERVLLGSTARKPGAGSRAPAQAKPGRRPTKPVPQSLFTAFAGFGNARLVQLWAIVRYELLMSWRRGSLRAILISALLLPQMFHIITCLFGSLLNEALIASLAGRPEVLLLASTNAALVSNMTTMVMVVVLLPLLVAETIPLDRQHRVREVLDTLPIPESLYVAGKLLSVWPVILIGLGVSGVLNGALSWAMNGPFQVGTLLLFWTTGVIPLALFASQMSVMFAAGRSSRRSAISTGLLAIVATLAASFVLPVNQFFAAGVFQLALKVAGIDDRRVRAAIPNFPDMLSWGVWLRIGGVILLMVAVWFVTVKRLQRRQAHRSQEAAP